MSTNWRILLSKVASAFLLVLLLAIYLNRLSRGYTQEPVRRNYQIVNTQTVFFTTLSNDGDTCQGEFFNEAILPILYFSLLSFLFFSSFKNEFNDKVSSVPHFYYFRRGPPTV